MSLNEGHTYREHVGGEHAGRTLAAFLSIRHDHSSEQTWLARIERGELEVNGAPPAPGRRLARGDVVVWHRPPWDEPDVPRTYELLHEDDALVAVAKPRGLPTMPAGGFSRNTLLGVVRERFPGASPLHRLGRETSGVVLFARTHEAAASVLAAWRGGKIEKRYRALASGLVAADELELTTPIGPVPHDRLGEVFAARADGKPSRSRARVLERRADSTLLAVDIDTGRPHQIRIHCAAAGHPLVGDPLYAPGGVPREQPGLPGDGGYFLHAERLALVHPLTGAAMELFAPVPADLLASGEAPRARSN